MTEQFDWTNQMDDEGETPLSRAVKACNQPVITMLMTIAHCTEEEAGETPLHKAAREQRVTDAKALIDAGADVDALDENGLSPLHWAAINGCLDLARLLVNRGANPAICHPAMSDLTPLALARLMRYQAIEDYLSRHGGY